MLTHKSDFVLKLFSGLCTDRRTAFFNKSTDDLFHVVKITVSLCSRKLIFVNIFLKDLLIGSKPSLKVIHT